MNTQDVLFMVLTIGVMVLVTSIAFVLFHVAQLLRSLKKLIAVDQLGGGEVFHQIQKKAKTVSS